MRIQLFILRLWIFVLIIFFCHTRSGYASFPDVGVGPRAIGMGGAFTAVADDAFAPFWNPAGLVQLGHTELATMRLNYPVENVNSNLLSLAWPIPKIPWSATLAFSYLDTGEANLYKEKTVLFSYGQDFYDLIKLPLALGVGVKQLIIVYYNYDPAEPLFRVGAGTSGVAISPGLIYQFTPNLKLALVFDNIYSSNLSINQNEREEDQNTNNANIGYRFGVTQTFFHDGTKDSIKTEHASSFGLVSAEMIREKFTQSVSVDQFRIGTEWWVKWFALRAGINFSTRQARNGTIGFGYRTAVSEIIGMQFDYAFSYFDQSYLGNYHRFSLSIAAF